jgi:hypothetical protein
MVRPVNTSSIFFLTTAGEGIDGSTGVVTGGEVTDECVVDRDGVEVGDS